MIGNGRDPRPEPDAAFDARSLEAALAALAAAEPPPLSEAFLQRVASDARREQGRRARAAPAPLRGDRRPALRFAPRGLRGRFAAGAVGIAASAVLGFFAGWTDLGGVATPGFADADLLYGELAPTADWEDAL
jgi:hypothetical protein